MKHGKVGTSTGVSPACLGATLKQDVAIAMLFGCGSWSGPSLIRVQVQTAWGQAGIVDAKMLQKQVLLGENCAVKGNRYFLNLISRFTSAAGTRCSGRAGLLLALWVLGVGDASPGWGGGGVQPAVLDRHEASKIHVEASTKANLVSSTIVPPMGQFKKVWDALGSGTFSCRALAKRCDMGKGKAYKFKKSFAKASGGFQPIPVTADFSELIGSEFFGAGGAACAIRCSARVCSFGPDSLWVIVSSATASLHNGQFQASVSFTVATFSQLPPGKRNTISAMSQYLDCTQRPD
eukprot:15472666-Alexandrium_andersonii.AAC.1